MPRIIHFTEYGSPDVLRYQTIETPTPAANEVLIRVRAIGLNRAESMWRQGNYVEPVKLPARLGYESAGVIAAVGAGVEHLAVGDRVSTVPSFSLNDYGLYGEEVLAPAHAVVKLPDSVSFEQATAIWNVFITPYGALIENGQLNVGDVVLVPAASSSVGLGTLQVVRAAGGIPVALTRTRAKREQLLAAGASHVIVTDEEDLVSAVNHITEGRGADIVFEPVGGANFPKLLEALRVGGTVFIYGALSEDITPLPLLTMIAKSLVIRGYNLFGTTTDPERQRKATEYVFKGLHSGELRTVIAKTFAFDEMVEAHRELEKNLHLGRIVVTVS
ncbi:zinc-dependent alcohol dehydrogenase family protein [Pseudomonas sp. Pseu.R1]|uniref:zinc-dependent alcohol dehydrogenase family protein n=1 Tax=Pseudomonas sp. Pseu.R1 TaxID=3379818 RepID=UPI003B92BF5D